MATSSNVFRRADSYDAHKVTVNIWKEGDELKADVHGPMSVDGSGIIVNVFAHQSPLSPPQALDVAVQLANKLGVEIVVNLQEGDWDPDWGTLT